jgi:hypothetical protein
MSKRSDGAASAASIEDAFCEWRGKLFRNLPERTCKRISCLHENSSDAGHEGSASL